MHSGSGCSREECKKRDEELRKKELENQKLRAEGEKALGLAMQLRKECGQALERERKRQESRQEMLDKHKLAAGKLEEFVSDYEKRIERRKALYQFVESVSGKSK